MIVITILAEGVHDVMLEHLHIAYPHDESTPAWPRVLNVSLSTFAYFIFYRLALPALRTYNFAARCLALGLIYLMLRETLRVMVIDGFLTDAYGFHIVATLPRILLFLLIGSLVVTVSPYLRSLAATIAASVLIAAFVAIAAKPLIDAAFAPALSALAKFDLPERYTEPYSLAPLIVIYATFIEAVLATFVIAAFVWPRLPGNPLRRLLSFTILVMAMKQSILPTLLFSFWIKAPVQQAMLSEGQFGLETLTLALLTGLTWQATRPRSVTG